MDEIMPTCCVSTNFVDRTLFEGPRGVSNLLLSRVEDFALLIDNLYG